MSKEKIKQKNPTSHFLPHTSNKGITLIALIITIVVMLILVAVVLMIALGENGVVFMAKKAKEEHEAAAFKEDVTLAAVGNLDSEYDWGINVDISGRYDWLAIYKEIKQKYPDANFIMLTSGLTMAPVKTSIKDMEIIQGELYCQRAMLEYINEKNWYGDMTTTQRATLENVLQRAKEQYINDLKQKYPETTTTMDDITITISTNSVPKINLGASTSILMMGTLCTVVVENNGTTVPISIANNTSYDNYIVMNKSEAEKHFELTDIVTDSIGLSTTIKSYKSNSKNVEIPGTLIDENGDIIRVTGIEEAAFYNPYWRVELIRILNLVDDPLSPDYEGALYNGTATLSEFKAIHELEDIQVTCEHGEGDNCKKISCKNKVIKNLFEKYAEEGELSFNLLEETIEDCYYETPEGILQICCYQDLDEEEVSLISPEKCISSNVEDIMISEGIQTIGSLAFTGCINLKTIYIPGTIKEKDMPEDLFIMTSLSEIKTMNQNVAESDSTYGASANVTKTFIEPQMMGY